MSPAAPTGRRVVLASLTALPGRRAELVDAARLNALHSLTREDGGCTQFDVVLPDDAPDRLHLVSAFADDDAFERHRATEHFRAWLEQSAPLLDPSRPKTHVHGRVA